jgi:hypothetical protein
MRVPASTASSVGVGRRRLPQCLADAVHALMNLEEQPRRGARRCRPRPPTELSEFLALA